MSNYVCFTGNLGGKPKLNELDEKLVLNFSIAQNREVQYKNQTLKKTIWHECSVFSFDKSDWERERFSNYANLLDKGMRVVVRGSTFVETYEIVDDAGNSVEKESLKLRIADLSDVGLDLSNIESVVLKAKQQEENQDTEQS